MCDDIAATLRDLTNKNVPVSEVTEQRWGSLASFTLPSGWGGTRPPTKAYKANAT